MSYIGPFSPEVLSVRSVISDFKSGNLGYDTFTSDWNTKGGKMYKWKEAEYIIDPALENDQKIKFPEVSELKKGDGIIFHTKINYKKEEHFRFLGDMKGIKRIFIDGKEIFGAHAIIPKGEHDVLLMYIHKNDHKEGIPFVMPEVMSAKLVPDLQFSLPSKTEIITLPDYETGTVSFVVNDENGNKKACRLCVRNDRDEPLYDETKPGCFETFTCNGNAKLFLPEGNYIWEAESGKEFKNEKGSFTIVKNKVQEISTVITRTSNINEEGWYASDFHNHTTFEYTPLLMESENIHIAYVPWWWMNPPMGRSNKKELLDKEPLMKLPNNRYLNTRVGEDERFDATLMFWNVPEETEIPQATWSYPTSMAIAKQMGTINDDVWIHLDHMFWWQTAGLLATGEVNSIEVLNNNFVHGGINNTEAWGKSRDMEKYSGKWGNSIYQQDVYFKILNSGIRMIPTAGSAACVGGGPFGYNRVYAHVDVPIISIPQKRANKSYEYGSYGVTGNIAWNTTGEDIVVKTIKGIEITIPKHGWVKI